MMNVNDMLNAEAPSDNTSGGNRPEPEGNNSGGNNPGHPGNNSDTSDLRLELAKRVDSTDSLSGKFYVRTKPTDGETIVCRLGNSRETSITHDILDAVRKTRSNETANVMQPRPGYRYNEMYPRSDNTENVNFPGPNEPINYIRQIPKE
ncbi:hypothetical protein BPOR_2475g00010 [Botrytis porri]|uniref:Uncharacterized protein n=1 Tax=Botrytis porri TaxID=87229 RepID=A0A4Z1JXV9_9HELO|nr:hypothetical protein BPOR_2475g00010 [Botrytis porri]